MDLHWDTVKEIDKLYMREQLDLAGPPAPTAIGVDEISIGPGHSYRIVVSDLIRRRAIWSGGTDRTEASMDPSHASIPTPIRAGLRSVVMDVWKGTVPNMDMPDAVWVKPDGLADQALPTVMCKVIKAVTPKKFNPQMSSRPGPG